MAHLLHPHPSATKIELSEPLAGAILISPWTNLEASFGPVACISDSQKMRLLVPDGLETPPPSWPEDGFMEFCEVLAV